MTPEAARREAREGAGVDVSGLGVELAGTPVVHAVSCAVPPGGWLALIGPNGAGKSTALRAMAGLARHTGTVRVGGADLGRLRGRERARLVAYVPQAPVLPPEMTVREYVLLGRTAHLGHLARPGGRDRQAAERALTALDLAPFADRRLSALSGGERQRVTLARALAQEPRLLLLDEPTSALDLGHEQHVLDLIDDLRAERGLTVVTTLHDLTVAAQYADTLVLLDHGRVAASGTPAAVVTERLISRVYAARVTVTTEPGGRPVVTPLRRP
ncbi:ATP-binding cassette domain-containing protein [Streptomyces sp. DW26H14]|uniref:ATP-binding cassette domain-containing protein n=1 Tax=Streptomyces sp. DW26H14 TaxID=3435395 RepID=UPI00403DCFA8